MKSELQELKSQFEQVENIKAEIRSEDEAPFLYVRSHRRAVEISVDGDGLFIEYWDHVDEESDEGPVKSEAVASSSKGWQNVMEWL